MKPIKTKDSNVRLILPEEEGLPDDKRRGDLHVERMFFVGEDSEQRPGFESRWEPTEGERKALINGAPITLRLWGANHPPVNMLVGNPPEGEKLTAMVTIDQTLEASSKFFEMLSVRMKEVEDGGDPIDPKEVPEIFAKAMRDVVRPPRNPTGENGNGASPSK